MTGRRTRIRGTGNSDGRPQAHVAVGIAHVAAGAMRVLSFAVFLFTSGGSFGFSLMVLPMVALAATTVLAGLWLADGQRRGGMLALGTDLVVLLAQLVLPGSGGWFSVAITAGLAATALAVLPGLGAATKDA